MNKSQKMLEEGSFWDLLIKLSLPAVIVIIIMVIYNMADTFFIGQTGDPNKISAISLGMPLFTILSGIGTLFGNGGSTSISIALGEKDTAKIKHIATFCFTGCLAVGLVFWAIVFFAAEPLAVVLGADENTLTDTVTYIRVFSFAGPFVLLSQGMGNAVRADGDAATAMIANIIGTISNIILDALFILVFGWDVFGAAFATVLGNIISTVIVMVIILKKKPMIIPHLKDLTFDLKIVGPVITLGLPMTFSTVLSSIAGVIANRMMIAHGSVYLAAQSVAGKLGMVITMMILGFCMGMQPAISYNFGSRNFKRMYKVIKDTGIFTFALGIILTAIIFIFRNQVVAAFIDNDEVIAVGQVFVLASVIIGPIYGFYQLSQTFMQATGKASYAIFASLLDKGLIYIPVLFIMDHFFGAYGLAFSHAVTMIFTIVIAVALALHWAKQIKELS